MRTNTGRLNIAVIKGVTLVELIVFLVVVSVALVAVLKVFNFGVVNSVDPAVRIKGLEIAQGQLDDILSRKFDENTPTGGVPACGSVGGVACAGILSDSNFDDVGDFNGIVRNISGFVVTVSVVDSGSDLGLGVSQARLITVNVALPTLHAASNSSITLSAYKVNY